MAGVPFIFGNATTSIPLSNLDANFNTGVTIGNTTVGLGNTVTTLGNVTLNNATVSSTATALPYASLPTGSVLQVVNATYSTQTTTSSTSFVDTGLTASITPKFATSKILIITSGIWYIYRAANVVGGAAQLVRNSTAIWTGTDNSYYTSVTGGTNTEMITNYFNQYLDSPATTSATTYKLQVKAVTGTSVAFSWNSNQSIITLMEIAA